MKKDKNLSIPIKISSLIQQIARPEYLNKFSQDPQFLAQQVDDLKTIIKFSLTNYTNKAKQILKMSRQYHKNIQLNIDQVKALDFPLPIHFQQSYPQLAYETFKRIQQNELSDQNIYFQNILTEIKLKFIESQGIQISEWQKYYNEAQREIQIQTNTQSCKINLGLRLQNKKIIWYLKGIYYYNNPHHALFNYYQLQVIPWFRNQYTQIKQSQKHLLLFLQKSLNYLQIIILYLKQRQKFFNHQISQQDKKSGILNLFTEPKLNTSQNKYQNIKLQFNLINSANINVPTIQMKINDYKTLQFYFIQNQQTICITVDLKVILQGKQQRKILKGSVVKSKLTLELLNQICYQTIQQIEVYQKLVMKKVIPYRMDLFQANKKTTLVIMLKCTKTLLYEQDIFVEKEKYHIELKQTIQKRINKHHNKHGIFIIFTLGLAHELQQEQFPQIYDYITINTLVASISPCLSLRSQHTQAGFIDSFFKLYESISYTQCMLHLLYYNIIVTNHFGWLMKFTFIDMKKQSQQIVYNFNNNILSNKKKYDNQTQIKQFKIQIKIKTNFKNVNFLLFQSITDNNKNKPNLIKQIQIQSHFYKNSWNQYVKKRKQLSTEDYLDVQKLFKTTYYLINHFETNKKIQQNQSISKKFTFLLAEQ